MSFAPDRARRLLKLAPVLALLLPAAGCAGRGGPAAAGAPGPAAAGAAAEVRAVADAVVDLTLRHRPQLAAMAELPGARRDRLDDRSAAVLRQRHAEEDLLLGRLRAIDERTLEGRPGWALYHNLRESLEAEVGLRVCREELWDVNHLDGWLASLQRTARGLPTASDTARARSLRFLNDIPRAAAVEIANLREGLRTGHVGARPTVARVVQVADQMLADPAAFAAGARSDTTAAAAAFREALAVAVRDSVRPALTRYRDFLRDEYLPRARAEVGVFALPAGADCYRAKARRYTTLALGPAEIRERLSPDADAERFVSELQARLGRSDGDRFMAEMMELPGGVIESPDALLREARAMLERAFELVPAGFARLPERRPEVVLADAARIAAGTPNQFIESNASGTCPPRIVLNPTQFVGQPGSRFLLAGEMAHEGWPGHALQVDRTLERVRGGDAAHPVGALLSLSSDAFSEGWGLYVDHDLAAEFGLYDDTTRLFLLGRGQQLGAIVPLEFALHENAMPRDALVGMAMEMMGAPREIVEEASIG